MDREAAVGELWRRGILDWKLRQEQQKLKREINNPSRQLVVGNISRRWGKSYTLCAYALEQAIQTPQKIRYGCAFLTDLQEFILPAFELILADCPQHLRPTYHQTKKTFYFKNGSEIKLVGLDKNSNGLRGNAINIIIIDEAAFVNNLKYLHTSVIIPATAKQKNIKIIFISTPPESPEHYFSAELIDKAKNQENGYYLCLTIDDISDLPAEERKRLLDEVGGESSSTAQREFFCKIQVDANRAICTSFADRHIESSPTDHYIHWQLFGDAGGVKDKTVFLEAGYDHVLQKVIFRSELEFPAQTPTTSIVAAVKAKWPNAPSLILDAPGQLLIDYSTQGLPATLPQKDDFGAGLLLLGTTFHNDQALIDPSCELLIRTLKGGLLTRARNDYERSEALGHCDAAATAIYALRCVDKLTDLRPKPKSENVFRLNVEPEYYKQLRGLSHKG